MRFLKAVVCFFNRVFHPCRLGCHRWDMPGGHCEDCGLCDEFFHQHKQEVDQCPPRKR